MEIWKEIDKNYQISNKGNIRSLFRNNDRLLKPYIRSKNNPYFTIDLFINKKRVTKSIHRLVAENFIDNPNNYPQVNHIDADTFNNNVENLEWCTNDYNMQHSMTIRLKRDQWKYVRGEKCNFNKHSEELIRQIPELINKGLNYKEVSKILNISPTLITQIKAKRAWKHLNLDIPDSQYFKKKDIVRTSEKSEYMAINHAI